MASSKPQSMPIIVKYHLNMPKSRNILPDLVGIQPPELEKTLDVRMSTVTMVAVAGFPDLPCYFPSLYNEGLNTSTRKTLSFCII